MPQEKIERNRAVRQPFVASAIVTEIGTEKQIRGVVRNLNLFGCYVETSAPFTPGAKVRLTITHNGRMFTSPGKVAHAVANKGMGVAFTSVRSDDQAILEKWMEQLRKR